MNTNGIKIVYRPLLPARVSYSQGSADFGRTVEKVGTGLYFVDDYDLSSVSRPVTDVDPVTGEWEQWDEYYTLNKHEWSLVVLTPPPDAVLSKKERALYALCALVRSAGFKTPTEKWSIKVVDELPVIETGGVSTPANTSSVAWGWKQVSPSVILAHVDGWTGSRDETGRTLYCLRSEWGALE